MARIARDTPMKAFDHVVKLLTEAGKKDGTISRDDAKALVTRLEKEGRGTEALAAKNIFTMIDARDQASGNRVTGYDLKNDRGFVQKKLLENRDINRDGYARTEIAKMSVTGRALVELGRTLELDKVRGRVPHATPERGLHHIATMIRAAAKQDLITSRADADKFAAALTKEGRGTEALAFATFYGFLDHRDAGAGGRITDKDITKAVDYATAHLLRNKDLNGDGYSKAEIATASKSAKAFFVIGQMIEGGILQSAMPLDGKDVQKALKALVKGMEFDQMGSEGGVGVRAAFRDGNFKSVTEKNFRTAFNMPKRGIQVFEKFTSEQLRTFLNDNMTTYKNGTAQVDPAKADKAFQAVAILRSLEDLKVIVTGKGDEGLLSTYIVGRAKDGSMVGIQTGVVWT